jgi:Uma2 family endonuclease
LSTLLEIGKTIMSTNVLLEKTNVPQREPPFVSTETLHTTYNLRGEYPKNLPDIWLKSKYTAYYPVEPKSLEVPLLPTQDDLPCDDGVPMETERHKKQMDLLVYSLEPWLGERGYVGGNMFVYFSLKQLKNQDFKGPDVFVTMGVSNQERKSWVVWEEGKSPDVIIELLSESTAAEDKDRKKHIYQNQLKVAEYFWFDPFNPKDWKGFRLNGGVYEELSLQNEGFMSQQLGLTLVLWRGVYKNIDTVWLRWATIKGELLLLPDEAEAQRAEAEAQRAETEAQRAEAEAQRAETEAQRAETEAQRAETEAQRAETEAQRAEAAEQRAITAFEDGKQKEQQETARKMLADGLDSAVIMKYTGLSPDDLATL